MLSVILRKYMVNTAELRQIFLLLENTLRHVVEGDGRYPRAMTPSVVIMCAYYGEIPPRTVRAFLAQWCWWQGFNEFLKDTFFRIWRAVKCLASDAMINWPRATHTARNNGFDCNVAVGYGEKYKRHDWTGQGQRTARIVALTILARWFL